MEQVLQGIVTVGHVILGGLFALMPGALVWLVVLGVVLAFRQFAKGSLYRR